MTFIKKHVAAISLTSSFILLALLAMSVAMDQEIIRVITMGYLLVYLLLGQWLKKVREQIKADNEDKNDENK